MKSIVHLALWLPLLALSPNAFATCLEEAGAFANRICGEVASKGAKTFISSSGELSGEAKGLVRRFLGSVGGELGAETKFETYEGVLHDQLKDDRFNARECGIRMAETALKNVCAKPLVYRTCRHPDFGQAGWSRQETLNGTSGWRGGGYNQDAYCTDFMNGIVTQRGLAGSAYKINKVSSSEEGRWTGTLNRHREYNYHCAVAVYWDPIYNERKDERCGVLHAN